MRQSSGPEEEAWPPGGGKVTTPFSIIVLLAPWKNALFFFFHNYLSACLTVYACYTCSRPKGVPSLPFICFP